MDELSGQNYVIEARGLVKKFGFKTALRKVDLFLKTGDCLALFGPNGAGKTTLIQILCSLMMPTSGKVVIAGFDTRYHRVNLHRFIGVISHDPFLYGNLTAVENLNFYGKMYHVPKLKARIDDLIRRVGLQAYENDPVQTYSRGMKQRLSVARAIIHDPAVLFLDEPFTGLDQQGADDLQQLLIQFRDQQKTIVMTSHNLARGLELCSHAAVLKAGELIYHKDIASIDKRDFKQIYMKLTGEKTWPHQAPAQVSYENSRQSYGRIFFPNSDPKN
jgi:heme exporter protein A